MQIAPARLRPETGADDRGLRSQHPGSQIEASHTSALNIFDLLLTEASFGSDEQGQASTFLNRVKLGCGAWMKTQHLIRFLNQGIKMITQGAMRREFWEKKATALFDGLTG